MWQINFCTLWLVLVCCWISADASNSTLAAKVSQRVSKRVNNDHFLIIVLTKNRAKPLQRLLDSIGNAEYGEDKVRLEIHVDYGDDAAHRDVLRVARDSNFNALSSKTRVIRKEKGDKGGLRQAWLDAWKTPKGHAIILEDDIALSPHWYTWMKAAWASYDSNELAGISLQRQVLIPMKPQKSEDLVKHTDPFLYKLVGSIGFSPHPQRWKEFLAWVNTLDLDTFPAAVPGLVTTDWYQKNDKKGIWTQLFIYFCEEKNLYTLYSYHKNRETLAAHMRERGEHFKTTVGADFVVANVSPDLSRLPHSINDLQRLEWNGKIGHPVAHEGGWSHESIDHKSIVYSVGASYDKAAWELSITEDYGSEVWIFGDTTSSTFREHSNNKLNYVNSLEFAHGDSKSVPFLKTFMNKASHKHIDILKIDVNTLGDFSDEIRSWLDTQWLPFTEILINFREFRACKLKWDALACKDIKFLHHHIVASLKFNNYDIIYDEYGDETKISFKKRNNNKVVRNESLFETAKEIHVKHNVISLQLLNEGFVEMTKNWICNVKRMTGVLDKTLFISTDIAAYDELKAFDRSLNVVLHKYTADKELSFGEIGYYNFMLFRTGLILNLLEKDFNLWLTESDATWIRDPTELVAHSPGDIVAMSDDAIPLLSIQGGFILLRPTTATKNIWTKLLQKHTAGMEAHKGGDDHKYVKNDGNEQQMLEKLIHEEPITVSWLSQTQFVTGLWYTNQTMRASISDPVLILNNWIKGNDVKVARVKSWGNWFLSDSEHECSAVDFSSRKYPPDEIPEHLYIFVLAFSVTGLVWYFMWPYRNKLLLFVKKWVTFDHDQIKM